MALATSSGILIVATLPVIPIKRLQPILPIAEQSVVNGLLLETMIAVLLT